ncbi:hypothetical protein F0L68_24355 [Solihabitans fulvus]|uniref:Uncharacterized protein n=1 Tax=Solihabitans fulvus TaxID=1892852 RepID=A0A5B2X4R5_9PSEU|nr:hypothetical protein [Solihabitans fulvus]KAA2258111.1 hypothetical protein F0L68_24355 [Solihabitans fulvus]
MFGIDDRIVFTFDEWRRLRVTAPAPLLPLAAWLCTDAQPNVAALDAFVGQLQTAARAPDPRLRMVQGNGGVVAFEPGGVRLDSLYDRWETLFLPADLFWPVLTGLRQFLVGTAREPGLGRPAGYPTIERAATWLELAGGAGAVLVNRTSFPREWSGNEVVEAGQGAWQSAELIADETTGAWSGLWRGMEIAGYYDTVSNQPLVYFPVISP